MTLLILILIAKDSRAGTFFCYNMVTSHVCPFHVWFVKVFEVARDNSSETVLILGSFNENQSYWIRGRKGPDFVSIHRFLSNGFCTVKVTFCVVG